MIAKKFAAELPLTDTGELIATASRGEASAAAFAKEFGGEAITGYEALLDHPQVDAVYLALPNGLHETWATRAMEAGKHVLCEKPLARSHPEAERMFAVAERTGQVLVEGFMYRTAPLIQELLQFVHSGGIGDLRLIRSNFTFAREVSPGDARYDPEQGGGSIMDVGCYCVHFMRALVGAEPTSVSAEAHLHESGVDSYAAGVLNFGGEVLGTFTCGMTIQSDQRTFIAGTKGSIEIDAFWFAQKGYHVTQDGSTRHHLSPLPKPLYALEADEFARCLGSQSGWMTRDDTLGNMRVLDQLRDSAGVRFHQS